MYFENKIVSLGKGRVSSVNIVNDQVVVFASQEGSLSQKRIAKDGKVSTQPPKIFSYADDAIFVNNKLLERFNGSLIFGDKTFEDEQDTEN